MSKRYEYLDGIRGLALISMILYHGVWDLVHLFQMDWAWFNGVPGFLWQQSICVTFIVLSGFCAGLGSRPIRRGLLLLGAGAVVNLVTIAISPELEIEFGILSCLGTSMLLIGLFRRGLEKIPAWPGFFCALCLFLITYRLNRGRLGIGALTVSLPEWLYQGRVMTYLGFMEPGFASGDYFPVMPWFFLFVAGWFFCIGTKNRPELQRLEPPIPGVSVLGRYSLWVYLLHQPVLYGVLLLLRRMIT